MKNKLERIEPLNKTVLRITAPSWAELLLGQLTSMADLMMVGSLGAWAIAGVGLSVQPKFLLMAVFIALNAGTTALVSRFKGMGDRDSARLVLRQAILLNLAAGVLFAVVGYVLSPTLIGFMGPEDDAAYQAGVTYLQIQMLGFPLLAVTGAVTAALRGAGNTRAAMVYNLLANGVNLIGNFLLIEGRFGFPRMGIAGASLSTVLGQTAALIVAFVILLRKKNYVYFKSGDNWKPDHDIIVRMTRVGFPAMLEQFIIRAGFIMYFKVVASLGTVALATHHICMSVFALSFVNGEAFGIAAASLMGQSLGAGKPDRAMEYARRARRMGMMVSLFIGVAFFFCGKYIIWLYNRDPEIIRMGTDIFRLMAVIMPFQGSSVIISGALRGAGDTRATSMIMLVSVLIVRPLAAYILVFAVPWGLMGAWAAILTDQLLRSGLTLWRLKSGKWKEIRV
ncbi:MAG: MATE family efflux transporter [Oscillospiraceae bacterium]|nr:MATE family efflux transporter [Oscillospiraceae bacterium]